jgi:hypothetical protein
MTQVGDRPDPVKRLVDVAVFAPIGLAAMARDHLPDIVETGRERVRQRLTVARFIGELVVQQSKREMSKRLEARQVTSAPRGSGQATPAEPAVDEAVKGRPAGEPSSTPPPPVDSLPIADYESLAASQVVARLGGLDRDDLDAIESFEQAHRNRRTVLGKIDQLRSTP